MLAQEEIFAMENALADTSLSRVRIRECAERIRRRLNPHPSGQQEQNVPMLNGRKLPGMQHKYSETVLFFPMEVSAYILGL